MPDQNKCLTNAEIERLHCGDLADEVTTRLIEHVNRCPDCAGRSASIQARHDDLLQQVRGIRERLMERSGTPVRQTATRDSMVTNTPGAATCQDLGDFVGPYKLTRVLGEGGFGVVYLAEQEKPLRRRVALKLVKPGMDSRQIVSRFEAERQALALMDHPCVARVFDAGTTEAGRPFFVMEYVAGVPITEYCKGKRLRLPDRLELFTQICDAVQHAHQKGIIHRDLKPSNVLVTDEGPKVIDFGIAKAIEQPLTDATLYTQEGQFVGTPEYMSPEQAGGGAAVDTRTDIYSLGAILYELLAGELPFDSKQLRLLGHAEMLRIIREDDPLRPGSRVTSAISSPSPSNRYIAAIESIPPDLDWITMKALEKEPARRYQSASELAADVQRFLNHEVVLASPPSTGYRIRKFVRRHRVGVAAGTGITVALILGVIGTGWMAIVANREKESAIAARNSAEQISGFQSRMLEQISPRDVGVQLRGDLVSRFEAAIGRSGLAPEQRLKRSGQFQNELREVDFTGAAADLIDRTILKPAIAAIDEQFENQPLTASDLRETLATIYERLGKPEVAIGLQKFALDTREKALDPNDRKVISAMSNMAMILWGNQKPDEAERLARESVSRATQIFGIEDPQTLRVMTNYGSILDSQGKLAEAREILQKSVDVRQRVLGNEHPDTLKSMVNLAATLHALGELDAAESLFRTVVESRKRVLGNDHRDTIKSISNLGLFLKKRGKLIEAEALFREAVSLMSNVLGENHPDTLSTMNNLGALLGEAGRLEEAELYYKEVLEKRRRLLPEDHPHTLVSINNMGFFLFKQGKREDAEIYFREALDRLRRVRGNDHPETLTSIENLALYLKLTNRPVEAEPLFREGLEIRRRSEGEVHSENHHSLVNLAEVLAQQGKHEAADKLLSDALDTLDRANETRHRPTLITGLISIRESWHKNDPLGGHDRGIDKLRLELEQMEKKSPR